MKALPIGASLFANVLRSPGFIALVACGALLNISLAWTTSFGLGREFVMIREALLGAMFIAGFAASLAACFMATRRDGIAALEESFSRSGLRSAGTHALMSVSVAAGVWTWLALIPFAMASLAAFHGLAGTAMIALGVGAVSLSSSAFFAFRPHRIPFAFSAVAAGALLAALAAFRLPDIGAVCGLLFLGLAPLTIACGLTGLLLSVFPGIPGVTASVALLVLSSMRGSLVPDSAAVSPWALLPDLYNLAPSMLAAGREAPGVSDFLGAFGYSAIFLLGLFWLAAGFSSLKIDLH